MAVDWRAVRPGDRVFDDGCAYDVLGIMDSPSVHICPAGGRSFHVGVGSATWRGMVRHESAAERAEASERAELRRLMAKYPDEVG